MKILSMPAAGMPGILNIVKDGVLNPNFSLTGAPTAYDAVNGRLTVSSSNAQRFLYLSPNIDISNYTQINAMVATSEGNARVNFVFTIDSGSAADHLGAANTSINTITAALSGSLLHSADFRTMDHGTTFYIYNLWLQ